MPDEGVTGFDDLVLGRIEVPNEQLEDVVLLRSDGRPTYNFASPVEDREDAITHVIRGDDHVSNTPKQIQILTALGAQPPEYAHVPQVNGSDGRPLSKRHGAVTVQDFRLAGYLSDALVNFLALLGWSYDDRTTIMSRSELVERFSLDRVGSSAAVFDYAKLDWLNGVYLRKLSPDDFASALTNWLRDQGFDWDEELVRRTAPLVQEKISRFGEYPAYAGFFFVGASNPDPALLDPEVLTAAHEALEAVEPFDAPTIEAALRAMAARTGRKPRDAFQPIRVAVTGSKVSPGLFESLELLGKDEALNRLTAAAALLPS
jgi:glutamyl-tRNA synthetase